MWKDETKNIWWVNQLEKYKYPMDFEEFLIANGNINLINEIRKCYETNTPIDLVLHEKTLNLYRLYLCVGGMPEAIKN